MTFASLAFALFFCVTFVSIWRANERSLGFRNSVLIAANLAFYASWDPLTIPLLLLAVSADYGIGLAIGSSTKTATKRFWFVIGLLLNLLPLVYLKYANFIGPALADLLAVVRGRSHGTVRSLVLPVGISFYTLAKLSYLIDVYRGTIVAERNYSAFVGYLSFFPVALAGPIERGTTLLPQLKQRLQVTEQAISDGVRQFLWGAIKKVAVADNLGVVVDRIFSQQSEASGVELGLGAVLFSAQVYCDFSGYSEMAMGIGRCLGINLTRNFAYPYFSRDIAEFWRRWHISLSSWFRDYVFFPLGANYHGRLRWGRNILLTFAVCGLWHGANWTFLAWGILIGLYFLPIIGKQRSEKRSRIVARGRRWPTARETRQVAGTFLLVTFAWIPFRAESLTAAASFVTGMLSGSWASFPLLAKIVDERGLAFPLVVPVVLVITVFLVEWIQRERLHGLAIEETPVWFQWSATYCLVAVLFACAPSATLRFLYADF